MLKKAQTNSIINTINEFLTISRERGITHLFTENNSYDGRIIQVNGNPMINFGSCSYLGLELDHRLKDASIEAVKRYGTQFSSARTYVSCTLYKELEELLGTMFNRPVVLSTCSSLGHQSVIPIIVENQDAVILDQQAHVSMQDATERLQLRGVTVTKLRHNRLDELQNKIDMYSQTHEKIWYFLDGVYSMYGDLAPINDLIDILNKNKKLHLYVDDAHGMSWAGNHGSGCILSQVPLHPRMVLTTSLAKGFGSAGGVFVFPNDEMYWKVKNWGGPLTYSGPQQPAVIGASIASAKIHLSKEINDLQNNLVEKILYCNEMLTKYELPLIGDSISPIFFVGLGLTKVGYNMVKRMADDGFYVNLGIFPAVPETCTGIRFTITNHHTFKDIENLAAKLAYHLPKALKEEERTMKDVYRAFRSVKKFEEPNTTAPLAESKHNFKIQYETTVRNIPEKLWNELLSTNGAFDWKNLLFLENIFQNNPKPEDNWGFHYYIIRDAYNTPILATFFTSTLGKDDMLAPSNVSVQVEEQRKENPYYLTSKNFMMGSLITNGNHLYLDKKHPHWKDAFMFLLDSVWQEQENQKATGLFLRDFNEDDLEIRDFLMDRGFVKVNMPENHFVENQGWNSREDFINSLPSRRKYHLKKNVLKYEHFFKVETISKPDQKLIDKWYKMYENVRQNNFEINSFKLPKKLFEKISKSSDWECLQLSVEENGHYVPVSVLFNYAGNSYCFVLIGMDYDYLDRFKIYKQSLFQLVMKGIERNAKTIFLGLTTGFEKRKIGATSVGQVAYIQMKDDFNHALINMIPNTNKSTL